MARRTRPILLLFLALASGGVAAFAALRYIQERATPLMPSRPSSTAVVVAARPLALGSVLGPQDIRLLGWTGETVPAGFFTRPEEVIGRGLVVPLQENEPILEGKLAARGAGGGLPVIIDEGMRALSVAVDQVVGVAGFVLPTTRVDVLLTLADAATKETVTKVLMQNVRTLAAGQSIQQDAEGKPQTVSVVTLLVTPEQAETLTLAANQGRIQLALRNTLDTSRVFTRGTRVGGLLGRVATARPRPRPPTPTPPQGAAPAPAPLNETIVEVYRGGVRSLQRF